MVLSGINQCPENCLCSNAVEVDYKVCVCARAHVPVPPACGCSLACPCVSTDKCMVFFRMESSYPDLFPIRLVTYFPWS